MRDVTTDETWIHHYTNRLPAKIVESTQKKRKQE